MNGCMNELMNTLKYTEVVIKGEALTVVLMVIRGLATAL
jgi:hypothetical protein